MTVDSAVSTITKIISNTLEEYDQSASSKNDDGTRIPHPLDIVDDGDKLFALDLSLKDIALRTIPVSLLEGNGSTASELKRVSKDYYVRVPATPELGQTLDIDDGLSYAVVFSALGYLWQGYSDFDQRAEVIVNNYDQAYRDYIRDLIAGVIASGEQAYIRFSSDGENWHDSYTQGDIYISFKRIDTDSWTPGVKFVGEDGQDGAPGTPCSDTLFTQLQDTPTSYSGNAGKTLVVNADENALEFADGGSGGGATKFVDLTDTPSTMTAGKMLQVNGDGTALIEVDPPSGGDTVMSSSRTFYNDDATGDFEIDCSTYDSFYLYPNGDANFTFKEFTDDAGDTVIGYFGKTYTFAVVNGNNFTITFDANQTYYGDVSIVGSTDSTQYPMTLLRMYYDGFSWIVVDRVEVMDYEA